MRKVQLFLILFISFGGFQAFLQLLNNDTVGSLGIVIASLLYAIIMVVTITWAQGNNSKKS